MKSLLLPYAALLPTVIAVCSPRPTTLITSISSAPSTAPTPTPTTITSGTACTVTDYASISAAVKSCTNIVLFDIYAPPSSTIDLQKLQTGAAVTFAGTTTFGFTPDNDFDPIVISGNNITITGTPGHLIDGNGPLYWDGLGSNGGAPKPDHFIVIKKTYNSVISGLNIRNWPVHCFSIGTSRNLTISGLTLDNSAGDAPNAASGSLAAAHNSDGFDISSSDYVTLRDISVVNQDDCVAVTSGTQILIDGMYCSGGHGLSIGSVGGKSNNTVSGVTFSNSIVTNSENGVRIKTNSNTTGLIRDVTYRNITLEGITTYGVDIQQDYLNGGPTGVPTNGVLIEGVKLIDVKGTVVGEKAYDYYVLCGEGSCGGFVYEGVRVTGGGRGGRCNYPASGCPL
ncbi:putative polygalacturonase precursor [Coniochaeta sp. 2T2.1]|nr:putative polygalacturonase precursor [Coniochaeta sp. 2T2.1]